MNKACFTAIVGNYEDLKEPAVKPPGWDFICFTDQDIKNTSWQIVHIDPDLSPQRMARKIKLLPHIYLPDYQYTLWLDASFKINVDLNTLWAKFFRSPFSCPSHPIRRCVFQEVESCIANRRGDAREIREQGNKYKAEGVQRLGGIITSGILFREKTDTCIKLCNEWWEELSRHSTRDQISFAKVSQGYKLGQDFHNFVWDYSQSRELKYIKHYHLRH